MYGKIEFRARVPDKKGYWAAGWLLGDSYVDEGSWPYCGEIDILENVVYLSAQWCPACKQNEETAEKLFDKYKNKVEMRSVDAESEIAKSYGFQLDLRQIPVLAFVIDGKPIHKMLGVHSMEDYDEMFQKYFPSLKSTKEVAVKAPEKVKKESKAIAELPATSENGISKSEAEETTSEDA